MKRIALVLILMLLAVPAVAGLKEKRAIKAFQDKNFPELQKQVNAAAGFDVAIEVDWDSLAVDKHSDLYEKAFTKVYFTPLIDTLKTICADDMGKDALKKALKKVVISNKTKNHLAKNFKFTDGVLIIDHKPVTNIDQVKDRTKGLTKLLEGAL